MWCCVLKSHPLPATRSLGDTKVLLAQHRTAHVGGAAHQPRVPQAVGAGRRFLNLRPGGGSSPAAGSWGWPGPGCDTGGGRQRRPGGEYTPNAASSTGRSLRTLMASVEPREVTAWGGEAGPVGTREHQHVHAPPSMRFSALTQYALALARRNGPPD